MQDKFLTIEGTIQVPKHIDNNLLLDKILDVIESLGGKGCILIEKDKIQCLFDEEE